MSNIIERFQKLEAEQIGKETEEKEREKRELEEAVNERTVVVNRELAEQIRPLASILQETKIEEILKEIRRVKKDLDFNIEFGASFATSEGRHWKCRDFSNISDIFSSEMIFPTPYDKRYYPHKIPETLLEAKSLKLEKDIFLRIRVRWDYWEDGDRFGHSYIYIQLQHFREEGRILRIIDGRGDNILNEEQLKSQHVVEDTIFSAILNPCKEIFREYEDKGW